MVYYPSALQKQLLHAIHHAAHAAAQMRAEGAMDARADVRLGYVIDRLSDTALIAGVPAAAVHFERLAGERGRDWGDHPVYHSDDYADRDAHLRRFGARLGTLHDLVVLHAVVESTGLMTGADGAALRGNMATGLSVRWQVLGAAGHCLRLTDKEITQIWSGSDRHISMRTNELAELRGSQLGARYLPVAKGDHQYDALVLQVMSESGVTHSDLTRVMRRTPDQIIAATRTQLETLSTAEHPDTALSVGQAVLATRTGFADIPAAENGPPEVIAPPEVSMEVVGYDPA
ncbi:hypothetical protein IU469_30045 [Nocardia puris]|uniref:Uncharacterized protein n=1 Tax=Nocardia puris TaxID=208602 RepID=A0A366D7R2_9NOCA|nr:hypothetical protein [Nocardia puris]MBF6215518.1 hypothetical protein [Nocardia puris]MBF6369922.1 hypothetical protein [Nocardia puris]RBO85318.1 hypothetical protein DFR74_115166 [Nocardia puris]